MEENSISPLKMIMIGGSAGSLEIILHIISFLPANANFCCVIIVHRKYSSESILEDLFASKTRLPVKEVEDKENIVPGTIYIAPADYHLLFEAEHTFSLDASEKIHFSRPSIDVSFESASEVFGSSIIGILLSGANADGAKGLQNIERAGGLTIIQDPATAEVSYMPEQALKVLERPLILAGNSIGEYLASQVR
jgi:two-component system, chemotaxis family, protein-glutamate methylesterase/glutaminase